MAEPSPLFVGVAAKFRNTRGESKAVPLIQDVALVPRERVADIRANTR
ncbi:hypothetical protein SAMN04489759_108151 [Sulfitobacter delicatus]|uniref:Uncharacterized protein n=1 Tax=Sulfitobacter delicatus TaxID=218672 RepID=A0A1G7UZ00_9RHOB|nr:hypothetical protein SAMN04489759_108151 [Sulfitobacter delicatus]